MLGRNSRQNLWVSVQAQLGNCPEKRNNVATLQHPSLSSGFVVALSRHLLLLLSKGVCRDKVYECRDINTAPMSSAFVASLSRQCVLTVFFDDCRDKLSIVVTNFLCLLLCLCRNRAVKCREKVQLIMSHNCCDKVSNVATFFPCLALLISEWFVATNFSMS